MVFTTTLPHERVLSAISEATGREPRRSGDGWSALCPAHHDRNPSLSIDVAADGRVLLHCHAGCPVAVIVDKLGMSLADLYEPRPPSSNGRMPRAEPLKMTTAVHSYRAEDGSLLYEKVRREWTESGRNHKDFVFRRPDPDDASRWTWSLGDTPRALYRLPELLRGIEHGDAIFYVEGEMCADALAAHGLCATTAGACKDWRAEFAHRFAGASLVVVWPDRDLPGWRHAEDVCTALAPVVGLVKVFQPPDLDVGELDGADAVDWLAAGKDRNELVAAVKEWAAPWEPRYFGPCTEPGYVAGQATTDEGRDRSSWTPVDLAAVTGGGITHIEPMILARSDGRHLLYPGRVHTHMGEPEGGKGWLAIFATVECLTGGHRVVYVDYESEAAEIVGRCLALGADPASVVASLSYLRPDGMPDALDTLAFADLCAGASLVIHDGMTDAMGLFGLDPSSNPDIARFHALMARPAARAGAAVVINDHVTKDRANRGRWAIGGQHKIAGVDVAYMITPKTPFGRGRRGTSTITVTKDRPGGVREWAKDGKVVGLLVVDATAEPDRPAVSIDLPPEGDFEPTVIMERIVNHLRRYPGASARRIRDAKLGRDQYVSEGLRLLVERGAVRVEPGSGNQPHAHYVVGES